MKKATRKNIVLLAGFIVLAMGGPSFGQEKESAKAPVEVSDIDASKFPAFGKWLAEKASNPVEYCVEKCKTHQIVILGEPHYKKDYLELFKQVAIEAYHKAGVRVIAMEACNAEDNEKIARLVEGDFYDTTLALDISRSENWSLWGYGEYWDVLRAVWELNKSLCGGSERLKVVGIDKKMDYQLWTLWQAQQLKDPVLIEKAKAQPDVLERDNWLMANLEKETIAKNRKGIVYVGFNHSFTHYGQPRRDEKTKEVIGIWPRMGYLLYQKYGEKVFQIGFHLEHDAPSVILKDYKGGNPGFTPFIEKIMAANGNKPVGFDVPDSPFAHIRDSWDYYFYWQPKATFADICRGYVFLKPYKDLAPCRWMENFVSDEMFVKSKPYLEYAYKRVFKNSREVNEYFASGKVGL